MTPLPGGAERKLVSVLAAEVDERVEEFAERDPEDVRAVQARHLGRVRAEVERFGGAVEHVIGGRSLAVFGSPRAHEDDPERAVRAALAIRDAAAGTGSHARAAVVTGEALVQPPGGHGGGRPVAGGAVMVSMHLADVAPADAVLVEESTALRTERVVRYGPRTRVTLPDGGTVGVRRALEPAPGPARPRGGRAPGFVARDRELATLLRRFAAARERRRPQLVVVVGAPGIGKSRLVAEFARAVTAGPEPAGWRLGRSPPYGHGVVWPLSEIVRTEAGILESDPAELAARKLAGAVRRVVGPELAPWVSGQLAPLVGLRWASPSHQDQAFAAWRRFLHGLAARRPLVLVFEDLQWADDTLLDFLESLVRERPDPAAALLVLATARHELLDRRPGWDRAGPRLARLRLGPLPDAETTRLLEALLRRHGLPDAWAPDLAARVGGNPLFAEEYVHMLRDRRQSAGDAAAPPPPLTGHLRPPGTVHAIIAARLDALPPGEKAALQDAAVLGRAWRLSALTAVGGHDPAALEACLASLESKDFVRRLPASAAGEPEYEFRHVVVRDVAYGEIVRAERAGRHLRAAAWVESLAAGRPEDRAELLVHHYQAALALTQAAGGDTGELRVRTALALRDAGDRAAAVGARAAAARCYGLALELCPADSPHRPELQARVDRGASLEPPGGEDGAFGSL